MQGPRPPAAVTGKETPTKVRPRKLSSPTRNTPAALVPDNLVAVGRRPSKSSLTASPSRTAGAGDRQVGQDTRPKRAYSPEAGEIKETSPRKLASSSSKEQGARVDSSSHGNGAARPPPKKRKKEAAMFIPKKRPLPSDAAPSSAHRNAKQRLQSAGLPPRPVQPR